MTFLVSFDDEQSNIPASSVVGTVTANNVIVDGSATGSPVGIAVILDASTGIAGVLIVVLDSYICINFSKY
jgi:hypothetical protein